MTMRNDATRLGIPRRDPRRPRAVVARQGLVLLDTDLDQQTVALLDRIEIETVDILGSKGKFVYPAGGTGFRITGSAPAANFDIGAGHGYLDGWLLENPAVCKLDTQPHPRTGDTANPPAIIGLKALVRHVDPVEDPALADVALGDAQASGRAVNDWQVFPLAVSGAGGAMVTCGDAAGKPEWTDLTAPSTGTMSVIKQAAGPSTDPCSLTPGGGYTRLENLLYRIEVHGGVPKPGMPDADGPRYRLNGLTVKLQRRNASLMARIVDIQGVEIKVEPAALDARHWFAPGAFAEIVNIHDDVDPRAAVLKERLFRVGLATDELVVLDATPAAITDTLAAGDGDWFLRLWDAFPAGTGVAAIVAAGANSQVIDLGDGLSIQFHGGAAATFRRGDYWTVAARADGSVAWPETVPGTPDRMCPHGPETRYAVLAVVDGTAATPVFNNCSIPFATLTDRLLFYRGGDGQSLFDPAAIPGGPPSFVPLPQRLQVAVMRGEKPVPGAVIRWTPAGATPDSRVAGQTCSATQAAVSSTDANGLSEVDWEIDRTNPLALHRVQASLVTSPVPVTTLANTIVFSASFLTAAHTGYFPGKCEHLVGVDNVQEALDTLCAKIEKRPPVLTLKEIKLLAMAHPIDLIRESLILNGLEVPHLAFLNGIRFGFDGGIPAMAIEPWDPVIEVELDLPYPTTDFDRFYWTMASQTPNAPATDAQMRGPFGFQRVRLDGTVKLAPTQGSGQSGLIWEPSAEAQQFLVAAVQHRFGQSITQRLVDWSSKPVFTRILCRLRLRSAHIWAQDSTTGERIYLNAEHLGTKEAPTRRELLLGERDPQRAADLDMFIYLQMPRGVRTFDTGELVGDLVEDLVEDLAGDAVTMTEKVR